MSKAWNREFTAEKVLQRLRAMAVLRSLRGLASDLGVGDAALLSRVLNGHIDITDNLARAVLRQTYGCEFEKCESRWRRVSQSPQKGE